MIHELEQGIYFTANHAFESTTGLGLTASSSEDPKVQQEIRRIASQTDFCDKQTRYSFLYSPMLGFCMTAATACQSSDDKRLTPYIHVVFSGRHPHDQPEKYGFSARFQTGEQALEGVIQRLKAEALPPWKNFEQDASVPQVAWLIQKLWTILCSPNEGSTLFLSTEGLPPEWGPQVQLAQVICKLAGLVPPSLRKNICATTAHPSGKSRQLFRIYLTSETNACRLDQLPQLAPRPDDYFGEFALKMATSYLHRRDEFYTQLAYVEQDALSKCQATFQRMSVASCCVMAVRKGPWSLRGQQLQAAYDRVRNILRNENTDRVFWENLEKNLRPLTPPKSLLELLKWIQEYDISIDDQRAYLYKCYQQSPESFCSQFSLADTDGRKILAVLWGWDEADKIMGKLFPIERSTTRGFFKSLCEQLTFWTPLLKTNECIATAKKYYSCLLSQAPPATLQDLTPLFSFHSLLLTRDSLLMCVKRAADRETRLPPLQILNEIPSDLLNDPLVKNRLEILWHDAEKGLDFSERYSEWRDAGKLLDFYDESDERRQLEKRIGEIKTIDVAEAFADKSIKHMDRQQISLFCKNVIAPLITNHTELDDLEQLLKLLEKVPSPHGIDYYENNLEKKLKDARLKKRIQNENLRGLLQLATSGENRGQTKFPQDLMTLWKQRLDTFINSEPSGECHLDPEDKEDVLRSAQWLEDNQDSTLAKDLCLFYLKSTTSSLRDLNGVKREKCRIYESAVSDYERLLADCATPRELYDFACSDSAFTAPHSNKAWSSITPDEQTAFLDGLAMGNIHGEILQRVLPQDVPFCSLLGRLCSLKNSSSSASSQFDEMEWSVFFDCLTRAASDFPASENTFSLLLEAWSRSGYRPTIELCAKLIQHIETASQAGKKAKKKAEKIWKTAFRNTDYAHLLKKAWAQKNPCGASSVKNCVPNFWERIDQSIENFFILLSYIPRAPVKALIWLTRRF